MTQGKKRGRPPKSQSAVRKGELIVYLLPGMLEDFRAAADKQEVSMSTLAGRLIENYLYGPKTGDASPPTATEIAREVVRLLHGEMILGDILSLKLSEPELVLGVNLSPQTPNPAPRAEETSGQHLDDTSTKTGDNVAPKTTRRRGAVNGTSGRRDDEK